MQCETHIENNTTIITQYGFTFDLLLDKLVVRIRILRVEIVTSLTSYFCDIECNKFFGKLVFPLSTDKDS